MSFSTFTKRFCGRAGRFGEGPGLMWRRSRADVVDRPRPPARLCRTDSMLWLPGIRRIRVPAFAVAHCSTLHRSRRTFYGVCAMVYVACCMVFVARCQCAVRVGRRMRCCMLYIAAGHGSLHGISKRTLIGCGYRWTSLPTAHCEHSTVQNGLNRHLCASVGASGATGGRTGVC